MRADASDVLRVQARAFNAHETLPGAYVRTAMIRDGEWLGEGPDAVQKGLEAEWGDGIVARLVDLDGEPVIAEYEGERGRAPRGIVRLEVLDGEVMTLRVDHDPELLQRLNA